jgi:hypothetical protein
MIHPSTASVSTTSVIGVTRWASPGNHGQIAVCIGRMFVYLDGWEALESFADAWRGSGR